LNTDRFICPRCGLPGYVEKQKRGFRLYLYVVHESYMNRGRARKRCYLGPATPLHKKHASNSEDRIVHPSNNPSIDREKDSLLKQEE